MDLGSIRSIDRVLLNWTAAYGRAYQIQISTTGLTWTNVYSTTTGDGGTDHITLTPADTRYVRVRATAAATQSGYSLWEIGVFNG